MTTEYGKALDKVKKLEEKIEQTRNGIINAVNIQKYNSDLVNFGRTGINEFGYQSTSIKGAFNMKYEWK